MLCSFAIYSFFSFLILQCFHKWHQSVNQVYKVNEVANWSVKNNFLIKASLFSSYSSTRLSVTSGIWPWIRCERKISTWNKLLWCSVYRLVKYPVQFYRPEHFLLLYILTHKCRLTHPCRLRTAKAAGQTDRVIHLTNTHTETHKLKLLTGRIKNLDRKGLKDRHGDKLHWKNVRLKKAAVVNIEEIPSRQHSPFCSNVKIWDTHRLILYVCVLACCDFNLPLYSFDLPDYRSPC